MNSDAYAAALKVELTYAEAALRRTEQRIADINAELRRIREGAPEAAVPEPLENTAEPRPKPRSARA